MTKKPSVSSEVRAYCAERDIGVRLGIKEVATAIGTDYGKVSAQMSLMYRTGLLAKEKKGTYITTVDTKRGLDMKAIGAPHPYTKEIKPGSRTTSAKDSRVLVTDFVSLLARAKEQMFDLAITIERMERAVTTLDLSLFPEEVIWSEIRRRRRAEGKEV